MSPETRPIEQRALQDVRALVDDIEREQASRRKWRVPVVLAIVVPVLLWCVYLLRNTGSPSPTAAEAARHACEMDAWGARSGEFVRGLRQKHPEKSAREIQTMLERERAFVMAQAKVDCDPRAK